MKRKSSLPHDWFPVPLPSNVVIGERSWLYSAFAFLHYRSQRSCGVRVGHDSGLYHGTFFDLGPDGEVEIGNYCTLVGAIIASNRRVVIGDYAFIAHEVVIADSFAAVPRWSLGKDAQKRNVERYDSMVIGENAWIGARAVLLAGARIGKGAIIGAAAVVDGEVPAYAIVAGNPAAIRGWSRPQKIRSAKFLKTKRQ